MRGYIVYHYKDNLHETRFPVFDYTTNDRSKAITKCNELGGTDKGYYVAQISEMEFVE